MRHAEVVPLDIGGKEVDEPVEITRVPGREGFGNEIGGRSAHGL
jgi:hypothetical protein